MLSLVSVISVNLIASLSLSRADSTTATAHMTSERRAAIEHSVLKTASRYVGTRYRMGGTKPGAFDCSGFVRYVYARHGVELPRTANDQSMIGSSIVVGLDSLEVGDLLFFKTPRGQASHVAIYAGNGQIIHASSGSHRVRYDDLLSPRGKWFISNLSVVRRVVRSTG